MNIFLGLKSHTEIHPNVKWDWRDSQARRVSWAQSVIENAI